VGFNPARTQALVHTELGYCGGLCGHGLFVLVARPAGRRAVGGGGPLRLVGLLSRAPAELARPRPNVMSKPASALITAVAWLAWPL